MKRIAIPVLGNDINQHFGASKTFLVVDLSDAGRLENPHHLDAGENSHAALIPWLKEEGVNVLICGGIGDHATALLDEAGIEFHAAVEGNALMALSRYIHGESLGQTKATHACHCGCHNH